MNSQAAALSDNNNFNETGKSIIRTMLYYDIFSYPLTSDEIHFNLGTNHITHDELKEELVSLCNSGYIYKMKNYFLLKDDESLIEKRITGNKLAEKKLHTAFRMSRLISKFPFVRGILLSGSLSKGYMEKDADIDYLIITYPNRVWLPRLLLMLFKKTILLNSRKNFCINYFIDYENLEIKEKNIFTATELATLIPTFGSEWYDRLYEENIWIKDYFPNFPKRSTEKVHNKKIGIVKSLLEKILKSKIGDWLDNLSMTLYQKAINKKYHDYNKNDYTLAFRVNKKEAKHHPKFFQKKILDELNKKILEFELNHRISLS